MLFPTMWYVRPQRLRSACAYAQSDPSLCLSLEFSMRIKLLTEHHLEYLSLKGGFTDPSESTFVKMPHCWKSRVAAHLHIIRDHCTQYLHPLPNNERRVSIIGIKPNLSIFEPRHVISNNVAF